MKFNHILKKAGYLLVAGSLALSSCDKFLEEDCLTCDSPENAITTKNGIDQLVAGSYVTLRAWYGTENGWDMTEVGTDIYTYAKDYSAFGFSNYQVGEPVTEKRLGAMWTELYFGLNSCNYLIENLPTSPVASENPDFIKMREGEVRFLRAHYLWQITETWGDAVLSTKPTSEATHSVEYSTQDKFYEQIMIDLGEALKLVPETTEEYGRITQPVVKAFLARVSLYQKQYDKALEYANSVINDYDYALYDEYKDVWKFQHEGDANSEVIWSVVYSNSYVKNDGKDQTSGSTANPQIMLFDYEADEDTWYDRFHYKNDGLITRDGGNQGSVDFQCQYENANNGKTGMRRSLRDGRGFMRFMPTRKYIESFETEVDERFNDIFQTVWYCNFPSGAARWTDYTYFDGTVVDTIMSNKDIYKTNRFNEGDTSIVLYNDVLADSEKAYANKTGIGGPMPFTPSNGACAGDLDYLYELDENNRYAHRDLFFPTNGKYRDTTHLLAGGERDVFVFRLAEMYLIAAEASLGNNDGNGAYGYLETLADARSISGDGAGMLSKYGVNSGADVTVDFILDERARELGTEHQRFFDLKRTGKLVERVKAQNPDAASIKESDRFRKIPDVQKDAEY